jgi:triacylglycerol lipase
VRRIAIVVTAVSLLLFTASPATAPADPLPDRAVVVVSGGNAVSPFTTPDQACATGLAAGNTDTAMRGYLLGQGYTVYTSPAMAGRGPVADQGGFGAFGDCAVTLPDVMTVDSTGDIDLAGEHLARFLTYLHTDRGVDEVDVVGHSMGGLYARAAIRVLQQTGSPVHIRSLTTVGTPWQGSYVSDYANGITPLSDCLGDAFCEKAMTGTKAEVLRLMSGSGREVNQGYLMGAGGWNEFQAGVLDAIPVVLIGGDRFTKPGAVNPTVWPNDGFVETSSELATGISDRVLPHRRCLPFEDTHSIFISDGNGLPWDTALTWDPRVFEVLRTAIEDAPTALSGPTRQGCPPSP